MSTAHIAAIGTVPARTPAVRIVALAALLAAAASIHLALTPTHFRESTLFGVTFLGIAVIQFGLAYALLLRPGARVFRVALWASVLIPATWMVTRLIPPPGEQAAESVEIWGVLATAAEIAALVGIATLTPAIVTRPSRAKRRGLAAAAGVGFAGLVLLSSGVVTTISPGTWTGPADLFRIYPLPSWRLSGVWMVVAGRWSVLLPWVTIAFVVVGGTLLTSIVSMALRMPARERCSARRVGALAVAPTALTVSVCCGAPLAAFAAGAGVGVGTVFRWTPWIMAASLALLVVDAVHVRRVVRESPDG